MGAVRGRALLVLVVALGLAACGGRGGASGAAAGRVGTTTTTSAPTGAAGTEATAPPGPTTAAVDGGGASSSVPGTAATPPPSSTAPTAGGGLRLGGDDLGVTRVGEPFRAAVAAVSAILGRPGGDPAPDTSCLGSDDETTWGSFRLAASAGRLSGWLSTSRTLATPAGVTVGTTLDALRQAYGTRLQLPPPAPDYATIFLVTGAQLGGTLTGAGASATVASLFNGTCEGQ